MIQRKSSGIFTNVGGITPRFVVVRKTEPVPSSPVIPATVYYTISGTVTDAYGDPRSGVLMNYGAGFVTTDEYGQYSIQVVRNYTVIITPFLEGFSFYPESTTYVRVSRDYTGQDYSITESDLDRTESGVIILDEFGRRIIIKI